MASAYIETRTGKTGKRYRAVLEWSTPAGPRRRKGPWTRYWKKANLQKQSLLNDAEDVRLGLKKAVEPHTWGELTEKWKKSRVGRAANTQANYDRYMIEQTTAFWGENCPLISINKELCVDFRESLREKGIGETTVKMRLQALKTCLYFAKNELGWIPENPMVGVEIPEGRDAERIYTPEEFWAIFEKAEPILKGPLVIASLRGTRKAELPMMDKRMLWRDEDGDLWIRLRKPTRFGIRSSANIKTRRKGERDIHIPPEALPHIDVNGSDGPIFHDAEGRLTYHRLRYAWERAKRATKLASLKGEGNTWHAWKHTAITRLLENGATLLDVKRLTGNTLESLQRYEHIGQRAHKGRMTSLPAKPSPSSTPKGSEEDEPPPAGGDSSSSDGVGAVGVEPTTSRSQSVGGGSGAPSGNLLPSRCPSCGHPIG